MVTNFEQITYMNYERSEIEAQKESLSERAAAITAAAQGLKTFLNNSGLCN